MDVYRCVRVGDPFRVRELAEALADHGIDCHVDTHPPRGAIAGPAAGGEIGSFGAATQLGVYVSPADFEAATQAMTEYEQSRMPAVEGGEAVWDGDPGSCPGCGSALPPASEQCGECGLEFPAAVSCPRCGGMAEPSQDACGICGAPLPT